jgi:hypothetical protein
VNIILSGYADADSKTQHVPLEVYMGLGIEPEQEAQTPNQLAAIDQRSAPTPIKRASQLLVSRSRAVNVAPE